MREEGRYPMLNRDVDSKNAYPDTMGEQTFISGMPVFDVAGEKIGAVSEHNLEGKYIVVLATAFADNALCIPLSAIKYDDDDGIHLNLTHDDLQSRSWDVPPAAMGGGH
jgi:hypothetical protein